jgi:hypothetical protein
LQKNYLPGKRKESQAAYDRLEVLASHLPHPVTRPRVWMGYTSFHRY